jgi:hypothetical protein
MIQPHPRGRVGTLPIDLDPALPDMAHALDPEAVARRFQRQWPRSRSEASINSCALQHARWTPGVTCVAIYHLTLTSAFGPPVSTLGVVTVSRDGVRHDLFTADEQLRGLYAATDPGAMSSWLSERLGRSVDTCSISPVSYRPGQWCVLRYTLSGDGGTVLYGKLVAGDRLSRLVSTIASLGASMAAPVIAFAPEWQLMLQADAGEHSLSSLVGKTPSAATLAHCHAGGRLLSRLHSGLGPPGLHLSLVEDADELMDYLPACALVSPTMAALFAEGIDRVGALVKPAQAAAPGHGDLRFRHVQLSTSGPVLIDLDSYCWAEPARDLGNLLAYLRWHGIRRPGDIDALGQMHDSFLEGYAGAMLSPLDHDRVRAFEAAALLKIAGRRYHRLAVDEWESVPQLVEAALTQLGADAGLRA